MQEHIGKQVTWGKTPKTGTIEAWVPARSRISDVIIDGVTIRRCKASATLIEEDASRNDRFLVLVGERWYAPRASDIVTALAAMPITAKAFVNGWRVVRGTNDEECKRLVADGILRVHHEDASGGTAYELTNAGRDIASQMTRHCAGWKRMWAVIAKVYGNVACACPDTGEVWQYMGTHNGMHNFRHRSLPSRDGRRVYFNVEAMTGDTDPAVATNAATAELVAS